MMLVTRLVLVIAALVTLAHGLDAKTPVAGQQEVISLNTTANDRQPVEKDESNGDHRQGRMALHAELPSSKVKREQALRNILAARRRQLLGSRVSDVPKKINPWPRTPRPVVSVSKDSLDMLEAQETRHGVYVTAPIGDQVAIVLENDDEESVEDFARTMSSTLPSLEMLAKSEEQVDRSTKNSLVIRMNETNEKSPKNVSQSLSRSQKNPESETRRKNTVAMPESLYNHFRPVESNIPVEDMTQFLYFGQKIHPESHNNSTGAYNSILDTTSTSPSVPISRRRYSMKRFSTTTAIPHLEEMINEEMNIALERSTIERNKIPKTKNVFRSPGSGTYFRKPAVKSSDHTIVSNVIPTRESARNASVDSESTRSDPSANAYQTNQVAAVGDRGSGNTRSTSVADNAFAYRARNATIGNVASFHSETETANSEENSTTAIGKQSLNYTDGKIVNEQTIIKTLGDSLSEASMNTETSTMQILSTTNYELNDEKSNKITTWQFVNSKGDEPTTFSTKIDADSDMKMTMSTINNLAGTLEPIISSTNPTDATTTSLAHSSLRIVVTEPMGYKTSIESGASWESAEAAEQDSKVSDDDEAAATAKEDKERDTNGKAYRGKESPVNQADSRKDRRHRVGEFMRSSDRYRATGLPSNLPAIGNHGVNSSIWSSDASDSSSRPSVLLTTNTAVESTLLASVSSKTEHLPPILSASSTEKIEHKPQHTYAYEITNVTRLLRNYTGPGLNYVMDRQVKEDKRKKELEEEAEEEEKRKSTSKKKQWKLGDENDEEKVESGKEEKRGPALTSRTNAGSSIQEIRNDGGSGQPTPQQSPLPLLLLPTLQRPSSSSGGIVEPAARMPGLLSAGTDVDEATASTTSSWNTITSTGSTPIIRIASGGGNSGARGSRSGDSSSQSPSASSSSSSSASSSSSSSSSSSTSSSSSSSSTSLLVGERGRKGALGARQQYHQQNQNRGIAAGGRSSALSTGSNIGARNTSPSATTTVTSTEVSGASTAGVKDYVTKISFNNADRKRIDEVTENILVTSTIRWNHTGIKKLAGVTDLHEGYGHDRRYLRKSVSAVLNQRNIEESLVKDLKRRRESTLQSGGSVDSQSHLSSFSRRIKGSSSGINEDSRSSVSRPMENSTIVSESGDSQSTTSQSTKGLEDAISEESDKISKVNDEMTEEQRNVADGSSVNINHTVTPRMVTMEKLPEVTTVAPPKILHAKNLTEETKSNATDKELASVKVARQDQVKNEERTNSTEEVTPGALNEVSESVIKSERTKDEPSDSVSTSITTRDTLSLVGNTQTEDITTTSAPSAFPVTPRMLKEPEEVSKKDESSDVTVDSDDQTKQNNNSEASRPFGLAKDLDPSEIQKMYRSQTTIKPESVMTTIIPGFMETSTDLNHVTSTDKDQPVTMNPVNSSVTRKPVGGVRSPEVRGRNLSDKIKDKDDVLPIMQLYNNSDIFNGTAKDSQEAVDAVGTVVLPGAIEVNATRQQNDSGELAGAATLVPDASESPTIERKGEESRPGQKHQHGNSDSELTGISKKSRHGTSREDNNDSVGPMRWSNNTNSNNSYNNGGGAQANRTRHRPIYYHPTPPEFIGYRTEFNGSFFEPGMISVSSRESVNISEVITKRHDGDTIASQETVAVVSYILATLIVFPIAVGVGLILRRLIIRNRKVLEESDTSSEISCRKDALNLENGDFKTSIEKAITKLPRIQHLCHEAEKPPPPPSQESRWEFPRDKLRLQTVLGQGNFGQVWKAEADDLTGHQGTTRLVAVKTVKEGASAREKEDLIRELEIMQQLGNHSNVVTLLGCCTEEEPHYLILEYVMYGKLLAYLRDHRTRQDFYNFSEDSAALTSRDLTVFGYCVARGMEYLASKKIIHRDLAARNVLVDHNKLCKIADFGMSRFANDDGEVIEARHGRNALPIRWMAPESLIYSLFTTKTDVWSFGILMWEIVTLGSTPYPDMAAREVMRNVQNGYRLERPSHCRSELFRVIARCWHADPDRRPEFQTLRRDMAQLLEDSMNGHYVDLESFASECTD